MKKSIYPPCLILLGLLLVPVTACTTKTAAEKPQDTPSRQEQPAAGAASHIGDTMSPQQAPAETQPEKPAAQPDAVSGATIDTISGATVSRQQSTDAVPSGADTAPSPAVVAEHDKPASDDTGSAAAIGEPAAADEPILADSASDSGTAAAEPAPSPVEADAAAEHLPIAANTETASSDPEADTTPDSDTTATEPAQPAAAANTADAPETVPEQNQPAYETTLADLITDFERQGGTHNYEPPPTFHEEMLDFFSPQIFTVALSKEPETEPKIKVSRMVAVEEKQRVEITYPGQGWVYVGEQTSQQGLKYEQRKLQDDSSIFMFTAEKRGDYVLHFSYFDVFTNDFITDAVAVSVSAARSTAAKSTVKAPEYQNEAASNTAETEKTAQQTPRQPSSSSSDIAEAVSAVQSQSVQPSSTTPQTAASVSQSNSTETASTEGTVGSVSGTTGNTGGSTGQTLAAAEAEEVLKPDQLLEKARTAIASADAGSALTYLDTFFATAEQKLDEGWFLKGRAYELNGSARNIRLALDAYRTLTGDFPQSKYWAEADARIRYITGFYINIQ